MKELPDKLEVGMKLKCCAPAYEGDEILEIFKVAGDRVWLVREDGVAIRDNLCRLDLVRYDYRLVE